MSPADRNGRGFTVYGPDEYAVLPRANSHLKRIVEMLEDDHKHLSIIRVGGPAPS